MHANTNTHVRLNAFLRRCTKLGYRERNAPDIDTLFTDCDEQFFNRIITNTSHILQQFISDRNTNYTFRTRSHNKNLIPKTSYLNDQNFLIRNLYKDCY